MNEKRKTIVAQDIFKALEKNHFESMIEPLQNALKGSSRRNVVRFDKICDFSSFEPDHQEQIKRKKEASSKGEQQVELEEEILDEN